MLYIIRSLFAKIQEKGNEYIEVDKVNKSKFEIISVGRLSEQKDYRTLLKSLSLVKKKHNFNLKILGIGKELTNLKKLAQDLEIADNVEFLGFKENPYPYIKSSDLFVLSSKWEGFGLVLVEALALGTPVIATDSNGAPSEILNNGEFGSSCGSR